MDIARFLGVEKSIDVGDIRILTFELAEEQRSEHHSREIF